VKSGWESEPDTALLLGRGGNCTQVPGAGQALELQGVIKPTLHKIINSMCPHQSSLSFKSDRNLQFLPSKEIPFNSLRFPIVQFP
jgi:hypothetical protein